MSTLPMTEGIYAHSAGDRAAALLMAVAGVAVPIIAIAPMQRSCLRPPHARDLAIGYAPTAG